MPPSSALHISFDRLLERYNFRRERELPPSRFLEFLEKTTDTNYQMCFFFAGCSNVCKQVRI